MSEIAEVTKTTFEDEVLKSEIPALVDFWAPWCGPCRMIAPTIDELAVDYAGRLKAVKLNTDQNTDIAGQYNIRGIPTVIFFKNGKEIDRVVGVQTKSFLAAKIDSLLGDGK